MMSGGAEQGGGGGGAGEGDEFLRGVESSTCLLLSATPTPPDPDPPDTDPLAALDPLRRLAARSSPASSTSRTSRTSVEPLHLQLQLHLHGEGDSSSSGDSIVQDPQDPVSAQLINNISMMDYQTLSKTTELISGQDTECKLNGNMNLGNRKLPNFVNWNWTMIRKVLLWVVVSSLIACSGVIIAMVVTLPHACNPDLPWYQGKVFYEVFPASFKDSNDDGFGDLKGLLSKIDYIQDLGATAIRLNNIFEASEYPEHYNNVKNLASVDRKIGTMSDFQELVTEIHKRNMSIILDIPVTTLGQTFSIQKRSSNFTQVNYVDANDELTRAIIFWSSAHHVDGFYLKGLENFADDANFGINLQHWKRIIGYNKILIASEEALKKTSGAARNVLLSRIDLIDVYLNTSHSPSVIRRQINDILTGPLWSKPSHPWVHWNVGNVNSQRLMSNNRKDALSMLLLELMLPGTISIFYGDEIALTGLETKEADFHEHDQVHNLVPMKWLKEVESKNGGMLPWNGNSELEPEYGYVDAIKQLIDLRLRSPTLYLNSINKEGKISVNTQIREFDRDLFIIERWYPRRNSYVFLGNFGETGISTDLSTMFYGGTVIASTNRTAVDNFIYFDKFSLAPHIAYGVKLDK